MHTKWGFTMKIKDSFTETTDCIFQCTLSNQIIKWVCSNNYAKEITNKLDVKSSHVAKISVTLRGARIEEFEAGWVFVWWFAKVMVMLSP